MRRKWGAGGLGLVVAIAAASAFAQSEPLTFRGQLSWINAVQHGTVLDSDLNPQNRALAEPQDQVVSELRSSLKLATSNLQLVARPRVSASSKQALVSGKRGAWLGESEQRMNEAFVQWTVNDTVTLVYGQQSYQWGAAETLSPSNRIFHDTVDRRGVLYEVRGRNLSRLNFTLGKSFSTVIMGETSEVKEPEKVKAAPFRAEATFQAQGLIKSEYAWNNGADYFGVVLGGREKSKGWIGEYFSYGLPFFDGLSIFADASHERASEAWYPEKKLVPSPLGPRSVVEFSQSRTDERKTYTLATAGLKYDFVNGSILRGEYVLNEAGYSKDERELALTAFRTQDPVQLTNFTENLGRFLAPGLELPGRRYAYASLHVPDLFTIVDLTLDARCLYALADKSSTNYAGLDYKIGDSGTATVAGNLSAGKRDSELRAFKSPELTLAYRHDW